MILDTGMKVLISHRRLFEGDQPRLFVGTVESYEDGLARVTGYTWIRDYHHGGFHCKDDVRTKIIAVASGSVIVYQLESSLDLSAFEITTEGSQVLAKDGHGFLMDLTEGVPHSAPALPSVRR
ncbi:MAG: hypothetical protein HOP15_07305 [Planctomycetes bacterium]|nr:hypothetical protein [Planctomycetota bacterium]